jgi:hypothetical protein
MRAASSNRIDGKSSPFTDRRGAEIVATHHILPQQRSEGTETPHV